MSNPKVTVVHNFQKRPNPKNLAKRSLSFAASGEIDHVGTDDLVHIEIKTETGVTNISVSGNYFLANLEYKSAKDGTKIRVFKF